MNKTTLIALGVFIVFAIGILSVVPPPNHSADQASQGTLLGVFQGVTPCADCPGIDTRLTLVQTDANNAEGTYELSLTYLESDVDPYVQTGIWTTERGTPTDADATVYALDPDMPDQTTRYLRTSAITIRQLDREGNEIDANLPFDLTLISQPTALLPEERTVIGTSVCLAHKDTTGPQTKECAQGIRDTEGNEYALDLSMLEEGSAEDLSGDKRIEVSGMFVPMELLSSDQWAKYQTTGIISARSIRVL